MVNVLRFVTVDYSDLSFARSGLDKLDHRLLTGDQLDFEAIGVLQERRIVVGAAREGVAVGVEERPAVGLCRGCQRLDLFGRASVQGEVAEPGQATVVGTGGELEDDVGFTEDVADAGGPGLVFGVAELGEEPAPGLAGDIQVGDSEFYVVEGAAHCDLDFARFGLDFAQPAWGFDTALRAYSTSERGLDA